MQTSLRSIPPAVLDRYREEVERGLRSHLGRDDLGLSAMLRYHMGWEDEQGTPVQGAQGKALRPTLCLLACTATGGATKAALAAAVAVELVHNFSLIHDDIQDGDTMRRHRPTVWALWGQAKGLLAGDALHALAHRALSWGGHPQGPWPAPPDRVLTASRWLTSRCMEMIEGQYLDMSFEQRLDVTPQEYLDMTSRKTGALIAAASELGALMGCGEEQMADTFGHMGRSLGIAFQIRDDILGIWGDPAATGKPAASDIRRRKKSFPIVYALHHVRRGAAQVLHRLYQAPIIADADVDRVLRVLADVGAREEAQSVAAEMARQALEAVAILELPAPDARDLQEIIQFVLSRDR